MHLLGLDHQQSQVLWIQHIRAGMTINKGIIRAGIALSTGGGPVTGAGYVQLELPRS